MSSKLEFDKILIEKYAKIIPGKCIVFYLYIKLKCNGKFEKITIEDIMEDLNITKPTIKVIRKILTKYKLIKHEIKLESGRKYRYYKDLKPSDDIKTSKKNSPVYPSIYTNNKSKLNINYRRIYNKIINKLLEHPRYNNDYYKNRKFKYGKKEEEHIKNFLKEVKNIGDYIEWWLKNKASKISGLSIGVVVCTPMIEEYYLRRGKSIKTKKEKKIVNKRLLDLRKEMIKSLFEDIKNKKIDKLSDDDRELVKEALKDGLLKKVKGKVRLNFE